MSDADPLGIVELGEVCTGSRARNLGLFATLGEWVRSTSDPSLQRALATACHRHAWHASLWEARTPTIPGVVMAPADAVAHPDTEDRVGWYLDQLADLADQLAVLTNRVDPDLDPSTARTIALVTADIRDLQTRTSGVRHRM